MTRRVLWLLGGMVLFLQTAAGAALAYTITGTVQNNTGNGTNRIYVVVMDSTGVNATGFGTSIASISAGGSAGFTIRGVPMGSYRVGAFMDMQNSGSLHINDPAGGTDSFSLNTDQDVGTLTLEPE